MKDNFSEDSYQYLNYRPCYPKELFKYINDIILDNSKAWDCGTGNGQVAIELSNTFKNVYATDISTEQIKYALRANNIEYSIQPAEKTTFEENFFDIIVAAQSVHWFNFEKFYSEVNRTAKSESVIAIIGYGRIEVSQKVGILIDDFYNNVIGNFWDKERRYIDENYLSIPFPFKELKVPSFQMKYNWRADHLLGYINTWSAVKHFINEKGYNPVDLLKIEIKNCLGNQTYIQVVFPVLTRIGKISKI